MMKKSLIALAVMAASATAAQAADVYGQVRMSVDHVNSSAADADRWQIADRVSRFGVKGSEDLGGGMSAVYGLEWGVEIDNSTSVGTAGANTAEQTDGSVLRARNQFVGLKGAFGTVLIGRHDTPYKLGGSADLFGDTAADSQVNTSGIIGRNGFDNRAAQTVAYISPDYSGFHFAVAGIPGEQTAADANGRASGIADSVSMVGVYINGPLKVTAAHEKFGKETNTTSAAADNKDKKATKINIGYKIGDTSLGYTYEKSNNNFTATQRKDKAQLASVAHAMGPITLAAQYGKYDAENADNTDLTRTTVGVIYNLSKRTSTYAAYNNDDVAGTGTDAKTFTMGLNHSF